MNSQVVMHWWSHIFATDLTHIFDVLSIPELPNGTSDLVKLLPFPDFHGIIPATLANSFGSTDISFSQLYSLTKSYDSNTKKITTLSWL